MVVCDHTHSAPSKRTPNTPRQQGLLHSQQ
jgi:hypothetical protein